MEMICDRCKKNIATSVLYFENASGRSYTIALCDNCKNTLEYSEKPEYIAKNDRNIISEHKMPHKCTRCGATLDELVSGRSAFCPECYSSFGALLSEYMVRLHGSDTHKGKRPVASSLSSVDCSYDKRDPSDSTVVRLNEALASAIRDERYEEAASIRDELKRFYEGVDANEK
jgi:protein arginine kinase activator